MYSLSGPASHGKINAGDSEETTRIKFTFYQVCSMKGSYFLVIWLGEDSRIKTKKKTFELKRGYYVYVGSAMNSIEKRVERHFRQEKKSHWHIDFLLKDSELLSAYLIPCEKRLEEKLSNELSKFGKAVKGFGASDLKIGSNLYYFGRKEPNEALRDILKKLNLTWKMVKNRDEIRNLEGEK